MRILLVEPAPPLARRTAQALRARRHAVDLVASGDDGDSALPTVACDLLRKRIQRAGLRIRTVRGLGYLLEAT